MTPRFGFHAWLYGFWFRVFGYGLLIRLREPFDPLFSERYGYVKVWYVGRVRIKALTPGKLTTR